MEIRSNLKEIIHQNDFIPTFFENSFLFFMLSVLKFEFLRSFVIVIDQNREESCRWPSYPYIDIP